MPKEVLEKNAQALEEVLLPIEYDADGTMVKLSPSIVKKYIANNQDISDVEYKFFAELCKARKLNPFLKEVHLIKYNANTPAQLVVGKDAILKRAVLNPQFDGREQGVIVQTADKKIERRKGTFYLEGEKVVGGWAIVYRKDWTHPVEVTVSVEETSQKKKDGQTNSNWENKTATMVEKVALVRALREAFVEETGGMIERDEAWEEKDMAKPVQTDPTQGERIIIDPEDDGKNTKDTTTESKGKKKSINDV